MSLAEARTMRSSMLCVAMLAGVSACVVGSEQTDDSEQAADDLEGAEGASDVVERADDLSQELLESLEVSGNPLVLASTTNRLGNTGFEAPLGNGELEAYQNWVPKGYVARTTTIKQTGDWSLRVEGPSATGSVGMQLIRVDGRATYRVSANAKVTATGYRRQRIYAAFYNLFGQVVGTTSIPITIANHYWHYQYLDVQAPPDAWYMSVMVGKGWTCTSGCTGDWVYYDNMSVRSL
jgi:hypothetical protein